MPARVLGRHAISRVTTALVIVIVVVAVTLALVFESPFSALFASSSANSGSSFATTIANSALNFTTSGQAGPRVILSDQEVQVVGVGVPSLIANSSVVNAGQFAGSKQYSGPANETLTLAVELTFNGCNTAVAKCPTRLVNVTLSTLGFSVAGAVPGLPIQGDDHGTNGAVEDFNLVITVTPPAAGYNGPLNIECTTA